MEFKFNFNFCLYTKGVTGNEGFRGQKGEPGVDGDTGPNGTKGTYCTCSIFETIKNSKTRIYL